MSVASQKLAPSAADRETTVRRCTEILMDLWDRHAIAEHTQWFTEDADIVTVVGQHLHGRAAIQKLHEQLHATLFAKSRSRILGMNVSFLDERTALVHMKWEMTGAAKVPGWNVPETRNGVMTLVWIERGGDWRVRAFHNTDIVPMTIPNP